MGKIIKITCVSCGHEWVNEIDRMWIVAREFGEYC